MTTAAALPAIMQILLTILGGGILGAWLTHRRLAPKSSAEAREITAAAMDKDWARFEREIDRLVKRCEKAEDDAAQARDGQRQCEERELELKARVAKLEAVNLAQGEIRARATEVIAADRYVERSLAEEKEKQK